MLKQFYSQPQIDYVVGSCKYDYLGESSVCLPLTQYFLLV